MRFIPTCAMNLDGERYFVLCAAQSRRAAMGNTGGTARMRKDKSLTESFVIHGSHLQVTHMATRRRDSKRYWDNEDSRDDLMGIP